MRGVNWTCCNRNKTVWSVTIGRTCLLLLLIIFLFWTWSRGSFFMSNLEKLEKSKILKVSKISLNVSSCDIYYLPLQKWRPTRCPNAFLHCTSYLFGISTFWDQFLSIDSRFISKCETCLGNFSDLFKLFHFFVCLSNRLATPGPPINKVLIKNDI